MKAAAIVILFLVGVAALSFYSEFIGLSLKKMFGPANVAVDNKIFHESQQYTDGMARDLDNMRLQYQSATDDQKTALKATIQHRFAGYDKSKLPSDLQIFLVSLGF